MTVKANDTVKVHYKGTLTTGEVFDTSEGREPLEFTVGAGQMIPGFDKGVEGMALNETKTINVSCADAYGEVNDQMVQEVPKSNLPEDIKPETGMKLMSQMPNGQQVPLIVTEVKDESIVVDANHPLAGKDLVFEVTVVEID